MHDISDNFCAPVEKDNACNALQRGDSRVSCLRVEDSAECSIRLAQGKADFGIFNAEELLLAYPFYQFRIMPILQLKHKDRQKGISRRMCRFNLSSRLSPKLVVPGKTEYNLNQSYLIYIFAPEMMNNHSGRKDKDVNKSVILLPQRNSNSKRWRWFVRI